MALTGQLPFGIRYGKPTATTRTMVLSSLVNTVMSVTCNGSSYPVTLTAIGTDRGVAGPDGQTRAGYAGSITITGLSEGISYPYTVTQGANSRSGTLSPFWATTPADFSFFVVACDRPGAVIGGITDNNLYSVIKDYATSGALPCIGYFHADDIGYADSASIDDSAYSGKQQVCNANGGVDILSQWTVNSLAITAHDFGLVHLAYLGLLGNTADPDIAFGQHADRVWCREHLAFFPQWGNHEFGTPAMYGVPDTWTRATPMHLTNPATGGWDGVGITAWDALFGPIVPALVRSTDAHSRPWAVSIGNAIKVVAPDWLSNKTAPTTTTQYGNAQVDDVLTALNSSEPFKVLLMSPQIRKLDPADSAGSAPYYADTFPTEYSRMFTATANPSVMQNSKTNGVNGATVCIHGDYHHAYVASHRATAAAGKNAELFYSINAATVNGSSGHTFTNKGVTTDTTAGGGNDTLHYSEAFNNQPHLVRVDVYGSRPQPFMRISLINSTGVRWEGRWYANSGNSSHNYDFPLMTIKGAGA